MIHLGGYNYAICYAQLRAWGYVQTEQLYPPKWIIAWSELGGNKDVNTLAEYVFLIACLPDNVLILLGETGLRSVLLGNGWKTSKSSFL